ncbi:MAG: hypothetical protein ABSG69_02590 [Candidatus Acidiferrum sp.]|jgi:hypothetical protein
MRLLWFIPLFLGALAPVGSAQATVDAAPPPPSDIDPPKPAIDNSQPNFVYTRPSETTKLWTYLFDSFGPYPVVGAAFVAGIDQADRTPPEWGQGAGAYARRFGSNLGVAAITTTTRYALAEILREDTVYYRCECHGVIHRMRHALISSVTSRRGDDGHQALSFPAIIAPYAGTFTAVYAWYPGRYGAKDALRMGNYALLAFAGENVALEFIYGGPHTLLRHFHHPPSAGTDADSTTNH